MPNTHNSYHRKILVNVKLNRLLKCWIGLFLADIQLQIMSIHTGLLTIVEGCDTLYFNQVRFTGDHTVKSGVDCNQSFKWIIRAPLLDSFYKTILL